MSLPTPAQLRRMKGPCVLWGLSLRLRGLGAGRVPAVGAGSSGRQK